MLKYSLHPGALKKGAGRGSQSYRLAKISVQSVIFSIPQKRGVFLQIYISILAFSKILVLVSNCSLLCLVFLRFFSNLNELWKCFKFNKVYNPKDEFVKMSYVCRNVMECPKEYGVMQIRPKSIRFLIFGLRKLADLRFFEL